MELGCTYFELIMSILFFFTLGFPLMIVAYLIVEAAKHKKEKKVLAIKVFGKEYKFQFHRDDD